MELQTIYTKVLQHLARQGVKAVDYEGACAYRAENGNMCAVGCLIPDDKYNPIFEGNIVSAIPNNDGSLSKVTKYLLDDGIATSDTHLRLLSGLQTLHDQYIPDPDEADGRLGGSFRHYHAIRLLEQMESDYSLVRPKAFTEKFGL